MLTFREYLAITHPRDVVHQDFVDDARQDSQLPDVATWRELRSYLFRRHGCREAIRSAFAVWANYQRFLLRHR